MRDHTSSSFSLFLRRSLPFLVLLVGINLFVISYLNQEHYIHFWDTSGYWIMYQDFGDLFKQDPSQALSELMTSIRYNEYNLLPILPLMPFHFLFGDGRLPYILAIVNLYAFPSILLFFFLFKFYFPFSPGKQSFLPYVFSLTLLFLPQFWVPVLRGFPDVIGVFIITMIMLLYFRHPIEKQSVIRILLISILLLLVILMRRWYAYWVVSFFIALFFDGFIFRYPSYRFDIKKYMPVLRNSLLIGILSVFLLFLIAGPVVKRMMLKDYADLHSAYRDYDSLIVPLKRIHDYFGFIPVFLFLFGALLSILNQETRRYSLFLFMQIIFIFLLFSRTQNFGPQHYYLLIPTITVFMSLIVIKILYSRPMLYKISLLVLFVFIYFINFSCALIPKTYAYFERFNYPFSDVRHFPLVRKDLGAINDLLITLDHLIQSKNDLIYVLSSSYTLNEEILINGSRLNHMTIRNHFLPVYHVDKRDGFPHQFYDAKYIILGEPIQYHLNPNDQKVIGILGEQILQQKGIGSSYERLPYEFSLDNNVKALIYEKKFPVEKTDIEDLSEVFISYYPDHKSKFKIYRLPCEIYDEPPRSHRTSLEVNYGNKVRLWGITSSKLPENRLEMSYYWQIMDDLGAYISFVHFTDSDNKILLGNDHAIGGKLFYKELIGKFIKETYFIDVPPSAVDKTIHVKVGIFSPDRRDRLTIKSSGGLPIDDSGTRATVGTITF
jgi:hypothetical protein